MAPLFHRGSQFTNEEIADVFIPLKKSKAGKRFAFVHFIKVNNLVHLVENLCTIWIGRYHLSANSVRFERPHKSFTTPYAKPGVHSRPSNPYAFQHSDGLVGSYVNAVNGKLSGVHGSFISSSPALGYRTTRNRCKHYLLSEYGISEALHPKLPRPEDRIVDFSEGKQEAWEKYPAMLHQALRFPKKLEQPLLLGGREGVPDYCGLVYECSKRWDADREYVFHRGCDNTEHTTYPNPETTRGTTLLSRVEPQILLGRRDIDLFNLIRATNPTKVKTGSRPRAAHEVSLLSVTTNRVIEMEDPATAIDSSGPSSYQFQPPVVPLDSLFHFLWLGSFCPGEPIKQQISSTVLLLAQTSTVAATPSPPAVPGISIISSQYLRGCVCIDPIMASFAALFDRRAICGSNPFRWACLGSNSHGSHVLGGGTSGAAATWSSGPIDCCEGFSLAKSDGDLYIVEEVRDPMDPWACKEETLLADAIAANVSRAEKKKKCRVVCRIHVVGSAHHARSDGVPVSMPTVARQGLAILLADAATQTETSDEASPQLLSEKEKLKAAFEQFKQYEDNRVEQRCAEMDARQDALSIDFDEELYPHMLTAIVGRRWMIGHGLRLIVMKRGESTELRQALADVVSAGIAKGRGKIYCGPSCFEESKAQLRLESIEAYDPEAEAKYVVALQVLKDLKYPLVDQLEGLKDGPMDVIMAALCLKSDTGDDAPQHVRDLRPSSSQLTIPVYPGVRDPMNPWACDFVYRSNDASHAVASGKLGRKWEGPYEVTKALADGAYKLRSMDGTILPTTWNIANLERSSNNEAEYEAQIVGLRIAARIGVKNVHVSVDSKLVANQVLGTYVAKEDNMVKYLEIVKSLLCVLVQTGTSRSTQRQVHKREGGGNNDRGGQTDLDDTDSGLFKRRNSPWRQKGGKKAPPQGPTIREFFTGGRIDIAGPFLKGPGKVKFLIVAMDYFTKWIEAKAVATITGGQVKKFVWDNIVCRFGIPGEIVSDNGKQFSDNPFKDWCDKLNITQRFTSVKHPQFNELIERANQSLGEGIKSRLVLPTEIGMPTYRTAAVDVINNDEELRLNLDLLEERRERAAICDFVYRSNDASYAVASGKLGRKWEGPYETPVYFVSHALQGPELNYTPMEKLVLSLVFAAKRLRRYFQAHPIAVITDQTIKQIMSRPDVAGRLQKWSVVLGEHNITYRPWTSVKGQVLANFLVEIPYKSPPDTSVVETQQEPWTLFTDGSSCVDGTDAGLILTSPEGTRSFLTSCLRCVGPLQAEYVIREIHEGSYSMHAGPRDWNANTSHRSSVRELRLNLDLLEERRERAAIREAKSKSKMTKYYNARVRGVTFRPGDFVYCSNDASHAVDGGKLRPKWEGPYEVTKALGGGAYKLRSMDGTVLQRTWNIANLKKCYL
nr:reverse transcriptase domain-containing protein [Tanacetum cinerariifolium]